MAQRLGIGSADGQDVRIDLASFYRDDLTEKIAAFRKAIAQERRMRFVYYRVGGDGPQERLIDPCQIVFCWTGWYVLGYCMQRQDFRLFKLWLPQITREHFEKRPVPPEKQRFGENMTDQMIVTAEYAAQARYRIVEEWGLDVLECLPDGRVRAALGFSNRQMALEWLLSSGPDARVLDPPDVVEEMRAAVQKMAGLYANRT